MFEKSSLNTDVKFISQFCTFLNFFLITPWYDFNKNSVFKPTLVKFYGCLLFFLKMLWVFYITTDENFVSSFQNESLSNTVIYVSKVTITTILVFVTIVKSAFVDNDKWKLIFTNLCLLDKHLQGVSKTTKIGKLYATCLAKHLIYVTFVLYSVLAWRHIIKISMLKFLIVAPFLDLYVEFLIVCLVITLVDAIKRRYKFLNKKLLYVCGGPTLLQETKILAQDYRILSETIQIFSSLFGYKIILVFLHCGLQVISTLNSCYQIFVGFKNNPIVLQLLITNLWQLGYFMVIIVINSERDLNDFFSISFWLQFYPSSLP